MHIFVSFLIISCPYNKSDNYHNPHHITNVFLSRRVLYSKVREQYKIWYLFVHKKLGP